MRGALAVVAVTAGAVIAASIVGFAASAEHATGGNMVTPQAYVAVLEPGQRMCQGPELVPAETGSLEVSVGTYGRPGPPLDVTIGDRASGSHSGGYRDGWVRLPFRGPAAARPQPATASEVCVRNRGNSRLALAGEVTPPAGAALVSGRSAQGQVTLRWRAARSATWWAKTGEIAQRVTYGKADLGPWAPAALLALVWSGAFMLVLRCARA